VSARSSVVHSNAVGSATAANLCCGDYGIASAPLVFPFCAGAAAATVCSATLSSVSTIKTIATVFVAVCLGLVLLNWLFWCDLLLDVLVSLCEIFGLVIVWFKQSFLHYFVDRTKILCGRFDIHFVLN
jgi:hypothetical protein